MTIHPSPMYDELEAERLAWQRTRRRVRSHHFPELERLIAVAGGDERLTGALLHTPEVALDQVAHICSFSSADRALLCSIHGAATIQEFAARLYAALQAEPDAALADDRCTVPTRSFPTVR